MKAVFYGRYSSTNQNETSIDGQKRECEAFAKQNDIEIIGSYIERAKSGTSDKRPEFQKMILEAINREFDIVLVYKMDRFSRSVDDTGYYKKILSSYNVDVISVTEQYGDETASLYMDALNRASAEHYSRNLAKHVKRGMKEVAMKCLHVGGTPPLGFDVNEERKYVINVLEAEIVRLIFSMYVKNSSYEDILKLLNKRGYKTKRGNSFAKNSLHSILMNEKYRGVYVFNRAISKSRSGKRNHHKSKPDDEVIRIDGGVPAIITDEIFFSAKKMLEQRRRARSANKAIETYLLQGIIKCGECGSAFQGNRRKSARGHLFISYRCSCRQNKMQCSNKEIKRDTVENYILYELENYILNPKNIPIVVEKVNEQIKARNKGKEKLQKPLKKALAEADKNIGNITKAIESGVVYDELLERLSILQKTKSDIIIQLNEFVESNEVVEIEEKAVKILYKKYINDLSSRDAYNMKQIIRTFVKEIKIYKDHIEVIFNMVFVVFGSKELYSESKSVTRDWIIDSKRA